MCVVAASSFYIRFCVESGSTTTLQQRMLTLDYMDLCWGVLTIVLAIVEQIIVVPSCYSVECKIIYIQCCQDVVETIVFIVMTS